MAEENLKDFTINWIVTGFLLTCLISFAVLFMANNNPLGLDDDSEDIFNRTTNGLSSSLTETTENADTILNITANTNPEASELGSRDSVASAYKSKETATGYWEDSKKLIGWIFSGDTGQMLIITLSSLIGFLAFYYIVKFIRNGI